MNTTFLFSGFFRSAAMIGLTAFLLSGSVLFAQSATSPPNEAKAAAIEEPDKNVLQLEKYEVTGSRIRRVDAETVSPIESIKMNDITTQGFNDVGEYIQSLPFNTGGVNAVYETASFTRGATTVNIRGLGSNRFLTLIDGRRAVPYALTDSDNNSVFDFGGLPMVAIESIEYLKDGASAIYGSDAISGVLNIKLKKNYSGLHVAASYGNTTGSSSGADSGIVSVQALAGVSAGKTRFMFAGELETANSSFLRDYGIKTTDYRYMGARGSNQTSSSNFPANVLLTRAQAAAAGLVFPGNTSADTTSWWYVPIGGQQQATPTPTGYIAAPQHPANPDAVVLPAVNRYDFGPVMQRYPASNKASAYINAEHDITGKITAYGQFLFTNKNEYYVFTPVPISSGERMTVPIDNPFNPFGTANLGADAFAIQGLNTRTSFGPPRKFDTESTTVSFLGGFKGTFFNDWHWNGGVMYGYNDVTTVSRNQIRAADLQRALNGTTVDTAFNPFGPTPNQALVNSLFTNSNDVSKSSSWSADFEVDGTLPWSLPGGAVGVALGAEHRFDTQESNPDSASFIGTGGGSAMKGTRTVDSLFVEASFPVLKSLEVTVAGRYENYSDFGNTTKPKVAAKFSFPKNKIVNVLVRASYSESFKAPDLGKLYTAETIAFSGTQLEDPLRPQDPAVQMRILSGGNSTLLPEESTSYYGGIVFEFPALKDFSIDIDYFDMKIEQVITAPSDQYLLSERGRAEFPNAIIRDNSGGYPGPILMLVSLPINRLGAYMKYQGVDLGMRYRLRDTRLGDWGLQARATWINDIGRDSGFGGGYRNNVSLWNNPKWRGDAKLSWNYKNWGASLAGDYIGTYFNDNYTAAGWEENSYTRINASLSYEGFWGTTITLAVRNLFDKMPPSNGYETQSFDTNTYGDGGRGRFVWLTVAKDF